jgi:hypothetical protein
MRVAGTALFLTLCAGVGWAQAPSSPTPREGSPNSTGRTVLPSEMKGVEQPQGTTGPLETGTGGAPPSSPQGQTPPAMQAAPQGSDKTIVDPTQRK